jgi:hypothetical protein
MHHASVSSTYASELAGECLCSRADWSTMRDGPNLHEALWQIRWQEGGQMCPVMCPVSLLFLALPHSGPLALTPDERLDTTPCFHIVNEKLPGVSE